MESQQYETPEEALKDQPESEEKRRQPTFLDRYKHFPWWVKYGPLIAVLALFFMPQPTMIQLGPIELGTHIIMVAGLISVLFSTISYRYFEHKSSFIKERAHQFFYAGLTLIAIAVLISFLSPPPPILQTEPVPS